MNRFHWYNYIGAINIVFIIAVIALSASLSGGIDFRSHPISALGADPDGGLYFNAGLIVFAVMQVLFALVLCHKAKANIVPKALFVIGGISLVLAGIFHYGQSTSLHNLFGSLCAVFVIIGIMMISPKLFHKNTLLKYAVYTSLMSVMISFFLQDSLPGARWEILLVVGIGMWNILLSLPLLLHKKM